ncbi:hypothetical protein J2X81_003307 [Sinomonas atrocyanea]|nr:hypothetical protein [Sinomonas atrocyanea]
MLGDGIPVELAETREEFEARKARLDAEAEQLRQFAY